jgi:hypothetical protein
MQEILEFAWTCRKTKKSFDQGTQSPGSGLGLGIIEYEAVMLPP